MMKRIMAVLFTVTLTLGVLTACKSSNNTITQSTFAQETTKTGSEESPVQTGGGKIALLLMAFDSVRYTEADKPGFENKCKELGYDPIVQSAEGSSETQIQQAENALNSGVSALVVQPCSDAAMATIVEMAHDANVPVIAYNEASNNVEVDAFVGRNSYDMYNQHAKAMIERYPSGTYVLVYGDEGTMVARQGSEGIRDAIAEVPDIKVVSEQFNSDWSPETAMRQVEAALSANNDEITAIICMNDSMAIGALQALDAVGLIGKVGLSGTDTELAVAQAIVEEKIDLTCFTEFTQMAEDSVSIVDCLLRGKDFPAETTIYNNGYEVPYLPTAYSIVTKDNMKEFLADHEWWLKSDEVYKNVKE